MREGIPMFNRLASALARFERDGHGFIAEGVLQGSQATVEGFVHRGKAESIGVVDSILHPVTRGFERFDYPSSLPEAVQRRMSEVACRVARQAGLDNTLFNVEMFYDPASDAVSIIEINPRMAGQFADLYDKVDGTHGYEIALSLAAGERPALKRGAGRFKVAASLPLRVYRPVRVVRAPAEADLRAVEGLEPGAVVWIRCKAGQTLSDFESGQDGFSFRYAVVNAGADSREELTQRLDRIVRRLDFRLEDA
jgi:biotin carboxylase